MAGSPNQAAIPALKLPLSWLTSVSNDFSFKSIGLLLSRYRYIYFGQAPLSAGMDLVVDRCKELSPGGFLIRGVSQSTLATILTYGGEAVSLGTCFRICLRQFEPSASLQDLARRGGRTLKARELAESLPQIQLPSPSWSRNPNLKYLYLPPLSESPVRKFSAELAVGGGMGVNNPLVYITISQNGRSSWHIESLIRDHCAPVGAVEHLLLHITDKLRDEGFLTLELGEVPFSGRVQRTTLRPSHPGVSEPARLNSSNSLLYYLGSRIAASCLAPVFSVEGLESFKKKFSTHHEPIYWYGYPKLRALDIIRVGWATRSIQLCLRGLAQRFLGGLRRHS